MALERILVLTGDHGVADPTKWDGAYSADDMVLHEAMVDALSSLGRFEIAVLSNHAELVARITSERPQLVVNFCDTGLGNVATRELHVPALLEIHDIPYTGAPPAAMVYCYDKELVSLLAERLGVPVAHECAVRPGEDVPGDVELPAFVKPARGDGSVGINRRSVVHTAEELNDQIAWLRGTMPNETIVVQEYLPGPEYGLALIGNPGALRPLPMLEVDYSQLSAGVPPILAFESKTGPSNPYDVVGIRPASLDVETQRVWIEHAERLFERLGCRDYARFDLRQASDGRLRLMEVNPNPAWSREAKLARMAGFAGIEYPELLGMIIDAAWARRAS